MSMTATAVGFRPLKRTNLTSQVAESVRSYITDNGLRPGDRLPAERELTEMLGVSRNILREALKGLAAIGLIEARQGDGTFVSGVDYSSLIQQAAMGIAGSEDDRDCIEQAHSFLESCHEVRNNRVLCEFRSLLGRLLNQTD